MPDPVQGGRPCIYHGLTVCVSGHLPMTKLIVFGVFFVAGVLGRVVSPTELVNVFT
jgi:hypothetical protein